MSLERFLDAPAGGGRTLAVVNRTEPAPLQEMLEELFADQPVDVTEVDREAVAPDTVVLLADGEMVATSPLSALEDAILMVNSDLFVTGTRDLEATSVPAVIEALSDEQFHLRGYPASSTEKLLLVLVSRHIEKRAYECGAGTLRSGFQRLSRIRDERGTRRVYERLGETDVAVHVYGVPDWTPVPELPVVMHGGASQDFRQSWFVVFQPPDDSDEADPAALLAIQRDAGARDGFWTYDAEQVAAMAEYIEQNL